MNGIPSEYTDAFVFQWYLAAIEKCRTGNLVPRYGHPPLQTCEKIPVYRSTGFNFNGHQFHPGIGDNIHFIAVAVSPEIKRRSISPVKTGFHQFGKDQCLENTAAQRVRFKLPRLLNPIPIQ